MGSGFLEKIELDLPDSSICYYPSFIDEVRATQYFEIFRQTVPWQQDEIKVFGKTYAQPRLTALFGDPSKPYSYSNIIMQPNEFSEELLELKQKVETLCSVNFTSCLLNLYRNGKDSNGWHADNEKELGQNPIIASMSLGQERYFHLKHRNDKSLKHKLLLQHGSLLMMAGQTQHHWLHQIPKTTKTVQERINLTFRVIK